MNEFIYLLLLGLSLSIDAFSVALNLGWQLGTKKTFATLVSIMHFIMPLLGAFFGSKIKVLLIFNTNYLFSIILIILAINTLINIKNKTIIKNINLLLLLILAISVSLDSFSLGIGMIFSSFNIILACFIFFFCSGLITYLGLILSKYLTTKYDTTFKIIGATLLLFLGIIHILM
jgi:putative Mn2+ efflux pump MntP